MSEAANLARAIRRVSIPDISTVELDEYATIVMAFALDLREEAIRRGIPGRPPRGDACPECWGLSFHRDGCSFNDGAPRPTVENLQAQQQRAFKFHRRAQRAESQVAKARRRALVLARIAAQFAEAGGE